MKKCDCFICNGFFDDNCDDSEYEVNKDASFPFTPKHRCVPKEYVGFTERYFYCKDCGKRIENEKEIQSSEEDY